MKRLLTALTLYFFLAPWIMPAGYSLAGPLAGVCSLSSEDCRHGAHCPMKQKKSASSCHITGGHKGGDKAAAAECVVIKCAPKEAPSADSSAGYEPEFLISRTRLEVFEPGAVCAPANGVSYMPHFPSVPIRPPVA